MFPVPGTLAPAGAFSYGGAAPPEPSAWEAYGLGYTADLPGFEGRIGSLSHGGPAADYMAGLCVAAAAGERWLGPL